MSADTLDKYPELVAEFVVLFGMLREWSPLLINKAYIILTSSMGFTVPFSLDRNPVVSRTQQILHAHYREGLAVRPASIHNKIVTGESKVAKIEGRLANIRGSIDRIRSSLASIVPLWSSGKMESALSAIGEGNVNLIEKKADDIVLRLIQNCSNELYYLHPEIKNKEIELEGLLTKGKASGKEKDNYCKALDRLLLDLQKAKTYRTMLSGRGLNTVFLAQKIKDTIPYIGKLKRSRALMTQPQDSRFKNGKVNMVLNFRYLELLRTVDEEGLSKPLLFSKENGDKFMLALGTGKKAPNIPASWMDLYVFNVNGMDDNETSILANTLERYAVFLVAERFKMNEKWGDSLTQRLENLKRKVSFYGADAMLDLGRYGGEVYCVVPSISDETVNFPLQEEDVKSYIKRVIAQTYKSISDQDVNNRLSNKEEFHNLTNQLRDLLRAQRVKEAFSLRKMLECFEDKLREIFRGRETELAGKPRPLSLLEILREGKINCEGFTQLALCLICHNNDLFDVKERVKVCYVPPEILWRLQKKIGRPHMFLIFESEDNQIFFDPTGLLSDRKLDLGTKRELYEAIHERYCTEIAIPRLIGNPGSFQKIKQEDRLLLFEGNLSSPYCVITSLKNGKVIESLKDYLGFMVYIPSKHIEAGMPKASITGTVLRRLLVCLSRNPNTNKLIILRTENDQGEVRQFALHLEETIRRIREQEDTTIEKAFLRGRMIDYGIGKEMVPTLINRLEVVLRTTGSRKDLKDLELEIIEGVHLVKTISLAEGRKSLSLYPIDVGKIETPLDKYSSSVSSVRELFLYAERILQTGGRAQVDLSGIRRIFVNRPFSVTLTGFDDLDGFLYEHGIDNDDRICTECLEEEATARVKAQESVGSIFAGRISRGYDNFCTELAEATELDRTVTDGLYLIADKEGGFGRTQIGWVGVFPYIERKDGSVILSFKHILRSVDLHDGLPLNVLLCIDLSRRITREIVKRIARGNRSDITVRLGGIEIEIMYLHAYPDNLKGMSQDE